MNRADFGLTWNRLGMVSPTTTVTIHAVFTRRDAHRSSTPEVHGELRQRPGDPWPPRDRHRRAGRPVANPEGHQRDPPHRQGADPRDDALVLTTIGARSGLQRSTPVGLFHGKDASWLVVASAAGGRKNPAWYHNIAAHPDQVRIDAGGHKVAVTAQQLRGLETDQAWQQITTAAPRYAKDASKTNRQLPIIRLTPRAENPDR